MKRLGIIGAGISGLALAHLVKKHFAVTVFESNSRPGGLIQCDRVNGHLYHMVGGHVFNSKRQDVLDFFWSFFDRDLEFLKTDRNAAILLGSHLIGYPIENHIYQLGSESAHSIICELLHNRASPISAPRSLGEFIEFTFGKTMNDLYFSPYNRKIWQRDAHSIPLSWLQGKLPMPAIEEILCSNIFRQQESEMVHSTFYYPKIGGSQFLADRLSEGLDIRYDFAIESVSRQAGRWILNHAQEFDYLVYTGNVRSFPKIIDIEEVSGRLKTELEALEYHGTTTVLCETPKNPYSWIYLPNKEYPAHRMIMTGNFSPSNTDGCTSSATLEFTNRVSDSELSETLAKLSFPLKAIAQKYTECTYPVQSEGTRSLISRIKQLLRPYGGFLLGRFAEWEYYNMDAAIGAALDLQQEMPD